MTLGHDCHLDVVVSDPPGVVAEGGRHHLVAEGVHIGGVALPVLVASGLAQAALAAGGGQAGVL